MMGTIQTAKLAFGWKAAGQRDDACQRCVHIDPNRKAGWSMLWCKKLSIYTQPTAICDKLAITPKETHHG